VAAPRDWSFLQRQHTKRLFVLIGAEEDQHSERESPHRAQQPSLYSVRYLLPLIRISIMASDICVRRLKRELTAMKKDPICDPKITVAPNETNLLEMHYVIEGSKGTPYEGGIYHGKLIFPKEYPLKPPSVLMLTPSGRFHPNRRLCLSMSDFHPESWNPMWSVSTILTGLYSFMLDNSPTLGSMETNDGQKRKLAGLSLAYNCGKNGSPMFGKLFPEYVELYQQFLEDQRRNPHNKKSAIDHDASLLTPLLSTPEPPLPQGLFMAGLAGLVAVFSIALAMRFLW
jgi:ubiquitin-conjugating enzyme E2 J2